MTYLGSCFCGAVRIEVAGAPEAMGYCHCRSCRAWSGAPLIAFTIWQAEAVRIGSGAEHLAMFRKAALSARRYCTRCGGHLMAELPPWGLVDVFAGAIPDFPFVPSVHINYAETVLPMKDGLPKLKDFPAELGGSGEFVAE
jgi:hypothetical protein